MRIDAHHHLWRVARSDYGWLTPDLPIYRDFELSHLRPLLGPVMGTVLIQAAPTDAETRFLLEAAQNSAGLVRGVVGWADLAASDAVRQVRRLAENDYLKGLRPMLQDLKDHAWILRDEVRPALRAMAERGLVLDLLIREGQLPLVPRLAAQHPELCLVVDHAAKPAIAAGRFQPWAEAIRAAASCKTVLCKLSGLVTEAGEGWTAARLRPYVDHVLDCFGPDRLIWGSDWPVLELASTYPAWRDATDQLLSRLSDTERSAVLGDVAMRVYRL